MKLHTITYILLVIGGLNWLLVVLGWDIAMWLGGPESMIVKAIYLLVGLSAIYEVWSHKKMCKDCC